MSDTNALFGGLDELFGLKPQATWFHIQTLHNTFYVHRDRVGGVRYSHISGNLHTVAILWTDGAETIVFQGTDDTVAAATMELLKQQMGIDVHGPTDRKAV